MDTDAEITRHYRGLEWMYNESAAINSLTKHRVAISDTRATVTWQVNPQFFHAAGSLHGSMYFKICWTMPPFSLPTPSSARYSC
ncbi:MAG: hypothetical protein U0176_02230 [Bacteroidia bacterium]